MKYKYLLYLFIFIILVIIIKNYYSRLKNDYSRLKQSFIEYFYPEHNKYLKLKNHVDDKFLDKSKHLKLIMNEHHSGFFCNFNRLIHYLMLFPNIIEIEFNIKSNINRHKPFIGPNVELFSTLFEYYKEPYVHVDDVLNISGNDFLGLASADNAYIYYNEKRNKLDCYSDSFTKYIKLRPHIQHKLDLMVRELKSNCELTVGIFVRSEALAKEQPSKKMPTREQY